MLYKNLGNSGIRVSAVALGTWGIGGAGWGTVNKQDSLAAIAEAIERGVTTIDTAPVYGFGDPRHDDFGYGYAETVLREALKDRDRSKLVLTTKCGLDYDRSVGPGSMHKLMTKEAVVSGCEGSLKRLGTDYIDVLFIHWPDMKTPVENALEGMRLLLEQGKIRSYGVSNFTLEDTLQAHKLLPMASIQPKFSMVGREFTPLMKAAKENGIGTMTYGSLGSGILTGAYREMPNFAASDMRASFYDYFKEPKFSKIQKLLTVMDEIAAAHGATPAQVAINWSVSQAFVDTAILGFSKPKHAVQNCAAFDWKLSDDEIAVLNAAIERELG